ncbi:MAG: hypothetical protein QNJ55_26935 [Xenococcus sp. MO_188.B8]|nr:hypothetical protein [Xenococcus sp. MO_188.B8]
MNKSIIEETLNSFIYDEKLSVLVLRGAWGIGKTYFWDEYVQEKVENKANKALNQTAYSYVSLFGLHDLSQLKSKIFSVGEPLKPPENFVSELEAYSRNENKTWELILRGQSKGKNFLRTLGSFSQIAKILPKSNQLSSILNLAEYGLINKYLICLDDIERKEKDLTIKQIMGLVDELCHRKGCKVILIFNYKTLEGDELKDFNKYREKIVDLEIEYKPTIRDNLSVVFKPQDTYFEELLDVLRILNISNIRIFKKLQWGKDKIWDLIKDTEPSLQKEVLVKLTVFCWAFFNSENNLSLSFISKSIKNTTWYSFSSNDEKKQQLSEVEEEWNEIARKLTLYPQNYDDCLIGLFMNGYLDEQVFKEEIKKINQDHQSKNADAQLSCVWLLYRNSFEPNLDEIKSAMRGVLDDSLGKISLSQFDHTINFLEKFGDDVSAYIENYLGFHRQALLEDDPDEFWIVPEIKNSSLRSKIKDILGASEIFNLDKILDEIARTQGWSIKHLNYLSSLSEDELYDWMISNPKNMVYKIKKGLLIFNNLASTNEDSSQKYQTIKENTENALIRIAKQNPLNEMRVRNLYKIEIPEEGR